LAGDDARGGRRAVGDRNGLFADLACAGRRVTIAGQLADLRTIFSALLPGGSARAHATAQRS